MAKHGFILSVAYLIECLVRGEGRAFTQTPDLRAVSHGNAKALMDWKRYGRVVTPAIFMQVRNQYKYTKYTSFTTRYQRKKHSAMMENQTISSYSFATLRQERVMTNAFTSSHTCAELRSWYTSFLLERNMIEYRSCVVRVRS